MIKTKAIITKHPADFKDMVLKLHQENPSVQEFMVAKTLEMQSDEFMEFLSDFQKPREWLIGKCGMCDTIVKPTVLRITSAQFPIALIIDTGGRGRAIYAGFEITE